MKDMLLVSRDIRLEQRLGLKLSFIFFHARYFFLFRQSVKKEWVFLSSKKKQFELLELTEYGRWVGDWFPYRWFFGLGLRRCDGRNCCWRLRHFRLLRRRRWPQRGVFRAHVVVDFSPVGPVNGQSHREVVICREEAYE